jgi:hypothetical protein
MAAAAVGTIHCLQLPIADIKSEDSKLLWASLKEVRQAWKYIHRGLCDKEENNHVLRGDPGDKVGHGDYWRWASG